MNTGKRIAPHETFDLHELLVLKTVSATKSSVMAGLVKDEELKTILQQDLSATQEQIKELQSLLQSSVLAPSDIGKDTTGAEATTRH